MKNLVLTISMLSVALLCCQNSSHSENSNDHEPEAFQEQYSLRKSHQNNLILELYSEVIEENSDLEEQEEKFHHLMNETPSVVSDFEEFNRHQLKFFSSAKEHLSRIIDTSSYSYTSLEFELFDQIEKLVDLREKEFELLVSDHQTKLEDQHKLKKELRGQRDALALLCAIQKMKQYEQDLPELSKLVAHEDELKNAISSWESSTKKLIKQLK